MQGVQHVPLWDNTVGNLTGLFREEAPRLRGAVTPGQQDFPWLETGRRLGYNFEPLLRGGQHLGLTRQRLSPQAIADVIRKARFAYNRLSDFEKNVMRRVVPFYTFTSRNIPLQLVPRLAKKGELVLRGNLLCSLVHNGCHTSFDKLLLAEKRAAHDGRLRGTDVRVTYQYHVDGALAGLVQHQKIRCFGTISMRPPVKHLQSQQGSRLTTIPGKSEWLIHSRSRYVSTAPAK